MNIVMLSPHFPPNYSPFSAGAKEAGHTVLGLADAPYESLKPELRAALTEYYRVASLGNYDELLRALGYFTHRHGKLDLLDSFNEYWLETEARLREDFNILGLRPRDMDRVKRKSVMKACFEHAGIAVARGRVCRDGAELLAFIAEVGLPVVAKPDVGVGAAKTYKLAGEADIVSYLASKPPEDYIVEEFIPGRIVTYDGLANAQGEVVLDSSLAYSRSVMDVVNEDSDVYYYMLREIPADLREAGQAVARAFEVRERFFHFEFFRLDDDSLVALEVNMRPPGGLSIDMFNYANDMDIFREWVNVVSGGSVSQAPPRRYFCAYAGRKDHIAYRLPHDEVQRSWGHLIVHQERINDVFSAAIGNQGYLLRHPELEVVLTAVRAIQERP